MCDYDKLYVNKQALAQAKQQGVKIVLCTGRPLAAMAHYLQELGLVDEGDYSITFNGGLVQKNDTGELISAGWNCSSLFNTLYKDCFLGALGSCKTTLSDKTSSGRSNC